jgi:hypothetical protein
MKELSTQEIVKRDPSIKEAGVDWEKIYALMHDTINKNTHRVMRAGNTLFWYQLLPDKQISFVMLTADPKSEIDDRTKEFRQAVKAAGLKIVNQS